MNILWDESKNKKLKSSRDVSFEEVSQIILEEKYLAILENPSRLEQAIFIIPYKEYTYVVPFVVDDENTIVLKTIFPSRKFHKRYSKKEL